MVQAADHRSVDDLSSFATVDCSRLGAVLRPPQMRPWPMVVPQVLAEHAAQLPFVADHHVTQALPPSRPDHALDERVLPWRS